MQLALECAILSFLKTILCVMYAPATPKTNFAFFVVSLFC